MRSLVDGDEASVSATALHCTARRGGAAGAGGGGGGGGTSAALLCVAPRGTAAGVRSVRDFASLEYVDAEATLGPDQVPPSSLPPASFVCTVHTAAGRCSNASHLGELGLAPADVRTPEAVLVSKTSRCSSFQLHQAFTRVWLEPLASAEPRVVFRDAGAGVRGRQPRACHVQLLPGRHVASVRCGRPHTRRLHGPGYARSPTG
jgi:hypothetical protein